MAQMSLESGSIASAAPTIAQPTVPMVMPANGPGTAVPLSLYPPGFDLSNFIIFNSETVESVSDDGYSFSPNDAGQPDVPQPPGGGGGGGGGGPVSAPETGFYQVVRNGMWLFGLTNDTVLSGVVQVPVEAEYDQGILTSVALSANGNPIPGTSSLSQSFGDTIDDFSAITNPPLGRISFTVDTRMLANGDYYLEAEGNWRWSSTNAYDVPYTQIYSPSVLVHITNAVSFPNWVQEFRDDLMLVNITSAQTNCDWRVDIYGQSGDYVRSFTNHTPDGQINISWNLLDTNGIPRTDPSFTTVTTIPNVEPVTNPPLIHVADNFPDQGMWMVTRANYIPSTAQNYSYYVSVANGFAQIGESGGGVLPNPPSRNAGEALLIANVTNVGAFARALTNHNVRNFYFDGHGGPDFIGYFPDANGNQKAIPSSVVAQLLGNATPGTNAFRYRFVWIDSCNSALGGWPGAFGMGTREDVPLTNYVSRPAAFCGFTKEVYGFTYFFHGQSSIDITSIDYRSFFQLFWYDNGDGLSDAFDQAEFYSSDIMDPQYLKIYGYWGLQWNQFNSKAAWPPP